MSIQAVVRWQDGSHDSNRICELCHKNDCKYSVYKDFYREQVVSEAYKNWITGNEVEGTI